MTTANDALPPARVLLVTAVPLDAADVSRVLAENDLQQASDALSDFPAGSIVTVHRAGEAASYREDRLEPQALRQAFGLPVRAHVVRD